jgi:hypothetical protein
VVGTKRGEVGSVMRGQAGGEQDLEGAAAEPQHQRRSLRGALATKQSPNPPEGVAEVWRVCASRQDAKAPRRGCGRTALAGTQRRQGRGVGTVALTASLRLAGVGLGREPLDRVWDG